MERSRFSEEQITLNQRLRDSPFDQDDTIAARTTARSLTLPLAKEVTRQVRARSSQGPSESAAFLRIIVWNEPMISRASVSGGMKSSIARTVGDSRSIIVRVPP